MGRHDQSVRYALAENAAELGALEISPAVVAELQRLARQLHRLDEQLCNGFLDLRGHWDEKATLRAEARQAALEERAVSLGAEAGLRVKGQRDPRGWPLLVSREPIQDNDTLRAGIVRVCPY